MPETPEDAPDLELVHPEAEPETPTAEIKFIDWLSQHRAGVLDVDLREAFQAVVQAVQATGKPGSVVLTLKVTPEKGGMFAVADKIEAKPPVELEAKLYWVDFDGSLTRDNPLQPKLLIPPSTSEQD